MCYPLILNIKKQNAPFEKIQNRQKYNRYCNIEKHVTVNVQSGFCTFQQNSCHHSVWQPQTCHELFFSVSSLPHGVTQKLLLYLILKKKHSNYNFTKTAPSQMSFGNIPVRFIVGLYEIQDKNGGKYLSTK